MRRCLELSLECDVSPTAFCVGSLLVLPPPPLTSTSAAPLSAAPPLILSSGFSREPPRPTSHAESSAVIKFLGLSPSALRELLEQQLNRWDGWESWSHEDVLRRADCYTTLEPCSIRTSGQPDCARLLASNQVRRVFVVRRICWTSKDDGDIMSATSDPATLPLIHLPHSHPHARASKSHPTSSSARVRGSSKRPALRFGGSKGSRRSAWRTRAGAATDGGARSRR